VKLGGFPILRFGASCQERKKTGTSSKGEQVKSQVRKGKGIKKETLNCVGDKGYFITLKSLKEDTISTHKEFKYYICRWEERVWIKPVVNKLSGERIFKGIHE